MKRSANDILWKENESVHLLSGESLNEFFNHKQHKLNPATVFENEKFHYFIPKYELALGFRSYQ